MCKNKKGLHLLKPFIFAGFRAFFLLSGKRGSNPRPSAWEADALPLSYSRISLIQLLIATANIMIYFFRLQWF